MTCAVEIVLAILIRHHGVVDKGYLQPKAVVHETQLALASWLSPQCQNISLQFVSSVYLLYFLTKGVLSFTA